MVMQVARHILSKPTPEHWLKPDRGRMAVNDYASGWDTRDSARAGRGLPACRSGTRYSLKRVCEYPAETHRTGARNRDPTIRDYFQKTESDLTRSGSQRLGALGRRRVLSRPRHPSY